MRSRRFIGSQDRGFIGDLVYAVLRHRAQLDWWLGYVREGAHRAAHLTNPRRRVMAALAII